MSLFVPRKLIKLGLLCWLVFFILSSVSCEEVPIGYNPCCSYPCQHGGFCMRKGNDYTCDCTGTEYFGKNCHRATWKRWFKNLIFPGLEKTQDILTSCNFLWAIVNKIGCLHRKAMSYIYKSRSLIIPTPNLYSPGKEYITLDSYYNRSLYGQDLPSIPEDCPTAMGVKGPVELPPPTEVFDRIFLRKEFKPCPKGTNLFFAFYTQHFTHAFLKSALDPPWGRTWGDDGVDASQIYGYDETTRNMLRCFKGGKLKMRIINGEQYPPFTTDVPGFLVRYPPGDTPDEMFENRYENGRNVHPQWVMGNPFFSSSPWIFVVATIWIREHNRVCDILMNEFPDWDDERLHQTARLIVTAELIKVTVTDYMQHLSQYKLKLTYEPDIIHHSEVQYSNKIRQEFDLMHQWLALAPEEVNIGGQTVLVENHLFTNNSIITSTGLDAAVEAMVNTLGGELTFRNFPRSTRWVTLRGLQWARDVRLQSFNNYRRFYGMKAYKSFYELTEDTEIAAELEDIYKDIDAVEFYVGMLIEKKRRSVVGPTMTLLGGAWTIKGMMANAIGSHWWWKPSTYGGEVGFNIIKKSTIQSVVCNNLKNKCEGMRIAYTVPDEVLQNALAQLLDKKMQKQGEKSKIHKRCGNKNSRVK